MVGLKETSLRAPDCNSLLAITLSLCYHPHRGAELSSRKDRLPALVRQEVTRNGEWSGDSRAWHPAEEHSLTLRVLLWTRCVDQGVSGLLFTWVPLFCWIILLENNFVVVAVIMTVSFCNKTLLQRSFLSLSEMIFLLPFMMPRRVIETLWLCLPCRHCFLRLSPWIRHCANLPVLKGICLNPAYLFNKSHRKINLPCKSIALWFWNMLQVCLLCQCLWG